MATAADGLKEVQDDPFEGQTVIGPMMDLSGSTITQGTRMALLLEYLPSDPFPQRRPQVSLVGSKSEVVEGLCSWRHVWSPQVWDEPTSSSSAPQGLSMPGETGGTGKQNLYQESLVWNWKNVKRIYGYAGGTGMQVVRLCRWDRYAESLPRVTCMELEKREKGM